MKAILKKTVWFTVMLYSVMILAVSCEKNEPKLQVSNVSFTPCKQDKNLLTNVDVTFTDKGVQITYYGCAVTCDFTGINVTHTFVNGVLNITQQGFPNQADCICYTDVSYTIEGISPNEINVIFINGKQIYCHNENDNIEIPYKECTHEDADIYIDTIQMEGICYLFFNSIPVELSKENDIMYIIYNQEDNLATFSAIYPAEAIYNGNVCNFPDFAKEWDIPTEGKQIYYKGKLHVTGVFWSMPPYIGGDLILTMLK